MSLALIQQKCKRAAVATYQRADDQHGKSKPSFAQMQFSFHISVLIIGMEKANFFAQMQFQFKFD